MEKQKLELYRASANQFAGGNGGSLEGMTTGTIRRKIVTLSRHLSEVLDYIEEKDKRDDAMDALSFSILNGVPMSVQDSKSYPTHQFTLREVKENLHALNVVNETNRNFYGYHNDEPKWDLTQNWLQMTNDAFFQLHGFNWIPPHSLQMKVGSYMRSVEKWEKVERELENGISEMRTKSLNHLGSLQQSDPAIHGLTKRMDQMNISSLSSSQLISNRISFKSTT